MRMEALSVSEPLFPVEAREAPHWMTEYSLIKLLLVLYFINISCHAWYRPMTPEMLVSVNFLIVHYSTLTVLVKETLDTS